MNGSLAVFWGLGIGAQWTLEFSKYITNYQLKTFHLSDIPKIHSQKASKVKSEFFDCDAIFLHSIASFLLANISISSFRKVIAYDPNVLPAAGCISDKISKYYRDGNLKAVKLLNQQMSLRCNGDLNFQEYLRLNDESDIGKICAEMQKKKVLSAICEKLNHDKVTVITSSNSKMSEFVRFELAPVNFTHSIMLKDMKSFGNLISRALNGR